MLRRAPWLWWILWDKGTKAALCRRSATRRPRRTLFSTCSQATSRWSRAAFLAPPLPAREREEEEEGAVGAQLTNRLWSLSPLEEEEEEEEEETETVDPVV
jgi:hypothetical protein